MSTAAPPSTALATVWPVGAPGTPCDGIDPTPSELGAIKDVEGAAAWAGLDHETQEALFKETGPPTRLRDITFISRENWDKAVADAKLNMVSMGRIEAFRRVCRLRNGMCPGDHPDAVKEAVASIAGSPQRGGAAAGTTQAATAAAGSRKLTLDKVVNQAFSADLVPLGGAEVRGMFTDYAKKFGKDPDENTEPSADQLSGIHQLASGDQIPYVDFAIFGPHGNRMLAKMVYVAFFQTPTGDWCHRELPGPPSFDDWWLCWRVYRTALLLLKLADPEVLDQYAETIRKFHNEYGAQVWFIIYTADVRMRRDRFERLRRGEERKASDKGDTLDRPWNACYEAAIWDSEYWQENLHRPAVLYLTGNTSAADAIDDGTVQATLDTAPRTPRAPRVDAAPHSARPREQEPSASSKGGRGKGVKRDRERPSARDRPWREKGGSDQDQSAKENGIWVKNRRGVEICRAYNTDQCSGTGKPCPRERAHQCHDCLQLHPQTKCRPDGGKGRGGGKGAGKKKKGR